MVLLKELEASIDKEGKTDEKDSTNLEKERVGYIYDGYNLEPRIQTRLKNGNWGAGKRMCDYDFYQEGSQCMDEIDRQIVRKARSTRYYRGISLHLALPFLV